MAEARTEDEEERMRESRDPGVRLNPRRANASSERTERNKPEQRHSSQGAFSSIRNAIKRTSTRSTSFRSSAPIDHQRDRRRPEITILSAEPLANNAWYPGPSAAFPPAAPLAQPSWTSSILTVQLPPPSYEQVIREKNLEENISNRSSSAPTPSPAPTPSTVHTPSPSSSTTPQPPTATIATQTDTDIPPPVRVCTRRSVRRPPKPPPPAVPLMPRPTVFTPAHTRSLIELDLPDSPCDSHSSETQSEERCRGQTALSDRDVWGDLTRHSSAPTLSDSSPESQDAPTQFPTTQKVSPHPRPHPRSKDSLKPMIREDVLDQPMTREVKVQTLVRLKDDGTESVFAGFTDSSSDFASNKYLQELLDVFGCDVQCFQSSPDSESDQCEKSEEEEDEAFESFYSIVPPPPSEPLEKTKPQPQPRTKNPKLPTTTKSSSTTPGASEAESSSEEKSKLEESEEKQPLPVPAPRPTLGKTPTSQHQSPSEDETRRLPQPPRHPVAARRSKAPTQADGALPGQPRAVAAPTPTTAAAAAERGKGPPGPKQTQLSAKLQSQRRPPPSSHTSARATAAKPSTSSRLLPLRPPPIKLAKSAGAASQMNATANQLPGYRVPKRGPPLPPRPKPGHPLYRDYTSKVQANANQNQTGSKTMREEPHFQKEDVMVSTVDSHTPKQTRSIREVKGQGGDLHEEPTPQQRPKQELKGELKGDQYAERQAEQKTRRRPKGDQQAEREAEQRPKHAREAEREAEQRPKHTQEAEQRPKHTQEAEQRPKQELKREPQAERQTRLNVGDSCVAQFAFEGETDELTLREGDVITLLERVNEEWGRGSLNGHTGLFPVSFVQSMSEIPLSRQTTPETPAPAYVGGRQTGRAMYDFTPECEDELCLKVGDIVCSLESVDEQWFEGEFRGRRGIVPKSYIQILKDPEPLP